MYTVQTVSVIISVVLKPKTNAAVKYTQSRTTEKDKNRDTDRKPKGLLLTSYPIIVPDKSSFHWNLMADVSVRDPRGGTTFIYGGLHYSRAPQPITQIRKKKKKKRLKCSANCPLYHRHWSLKITAVRFTRQSMSGDCHVDVPNWKDQLSRFPRTKCNGPQVLCLIATPNDQG